ncbi:hypothetical protein P170DRAFT_464400 [Aspergillus steynii IBT 23096]|uniref:Uncharacterized protein n=1 Tax=Aspergillus steynii IBT 23096 TaxID=1392250 RepID=A0A2I2G7B7_9EURO|nr:uncharacterized protein P170DRAFT_464400 [Aspergillus steynii IBT 23096]PLB48776.1 hypothetical protein P170DRAFT_464400 [Aspergillus steynii IBT 23096]
MYLVVQDWCIYLATAEKALNYIQLNELAVVSVGGCPGHNIVVWGAFHSLGDLYFDQGKLQEAEEMYQRALAGKEKALGSDHMSTLQTVNNIGNLYTDQGKLQEAEEMYQRALAGKEKALGSDHTSTLDTVNNLVILYSDQGKQQEAEEMFQRALAGCEKTLDPDHNRT